MALKCRKEKVIINVAYGQTASLMSATMEVLDSLGGRVDTIIVAKTSNIICGGMKPTNWLQIKDQWKHFRHITFPKLGERSKMDVPISSDYYILLLPIKEARGGDNQPSARLCPMEWTAIGTTGKRTCEGHPMQQSECSDGDMKYLLKQF